METFIEKGMLILSSILTLSLTNKVDYPNDKTNIIEFVEKNKISLSSINFDSINKLIDSLTYERILIAQQYQESKFKANACSYVGAQGIAQFMPSTWKWVKVKANLPQNALPTNPQHALKAQKYYMNYLLGLSYINGDIYKALASYNCGQGRLQRLLKNHGDNWYNYLPNENKTYLKRIEKWYNDTTLLSPFQTTPPPYYEFTYIKENMTFLP